MRMVASTENKARKSIALADELHELCVLECTFKNNTVKFKLPKNLCFLPRLLQL